MSQNLVDVISGQASAPVPLPAAASALRKRFADPAALQAVITLISNPDGSLTVGESDGSRWRYVAGPSEPGVWRIDQTQYFTNCGWGLLGAGSDLRNRSITFDRSNNIYLLTSLGGIKREYRQGRLSTETDANGICTLFEYDRDGKLSSIQVIGRDGRETLAWLGWRHEQGCVVEGSDGLAISYSFDILGRLEAVGAVKDGKTYFHYDDVGRLARYEQPDGYFVTVEYGRDGKVSALSAPIGHDESPLLHGTYCYSSGCTEVIDAEGAVTRYLIDGGRLVGKEEYGYDAEPYRTERYWWSSEGYLTSIALVDGKGHVVSCRTFEYDDHGNVVREALHGNLSGRASASLTVDDYGMPVGVKVESHATYYVYDAWHRVAEKIKDNGVFTAFAYVGDTDLVRAKWISDQSGVRLRYLYTYNSAGQLTDTIVDDGKGNDSSDLSDVTQRRIVSVAYAGGRPLLVDEKYLDFTSNDEVIQKTLLYQYDGNGRIVEKQEIDGKGVCLQATRMAHDKLGRLISASEDGDSIRQYRYDSAGRIVCARDSGSRASVSSTYDLAGRLIANDVIDTKQRTFHRSHRHDLMGRCIATVDIYGNETHHFYDAWGREVRTIYPANNDGLQPVIERVYDICDRPVSIIDPAGYVTHLSYNAYGNPTKIKHPNGTEEIFEYDLDGSLCRSIAANGVVTSIERDFLSRVVQQSLSGTSGGEYFTTASYNAFAMVEATDPMGQHTLFSYDNAGRLMSKVLEWTDGSAQVDFDYDQHNNIVNTKVWFGHGEDDYLITKIDRNESGKVIGVQLLDSMTRKLVSEDYLQPELWERSDDLNVEEDFSHRNANGQKVLRRKVTGKNGTTVITTYDALGHVISEEVCNAFGILENAVTNRYDAVGNLVEHHQEVVDDDQTIIDITTHRYGPAGRLECTIEHAGTSAAATTQYHYNSFGQLSQVVKPSKVCLDLTYDEFGRIQRLHSSDGTVDYFYSYDALNRPIEAVDQVHGDAVFRLYHALGGVAYEELSDGLVITKSYDRQGRLECLVLPDQSAIGYSYDAALMTAVKRLSPSGECLYSHQYNRFDSQGRPTLMTQAGNAGTISFVWDKIGRAKEITSKWWSQRINDRNDAGSVVRSRVWDFGGRHELKYSYDDLGRLTSEKGVFDKKYSYDSFGSRREGLLDHHKDINGNVTVRTVDGVQQHLSYDALDRLIKVVIPDELQVDYTYDAFGRRTTKTVTKDYSQPVTVRYLYDNDKEIGAVDHFGNIIELRLLGIGISGDVGATVAIELEGDVFAPVHDWRGNIACLVSIEGYPAECYRYGAYGLEKIYGADGQLVSKDEAMSPWRFSGKRVDSEVDLIHYGWRYYDAHSGRWLTADPAGTIDGTNRYAFVRNNPIAFIDPQGLFSIPDLWNSAYSATKYYLRELGVLGDSVAFLFEREMALLDDIMDDVRFVAQELVGPMLFMLAGLQGESIQFGVYGNGEFNDNVRVSFINGMLCDSASIYEATKLISETHGGVNVHYTFRPTKGWAGDIITGLMTIGGYTSPVARRLSEGWRELIEEVGGVGNGGIVVHYAHSLGGAETLRASELMTPEELKMIRVITIGSVKVLPDEGFSNVRQYMSAFDWAIAIDPVKYLTALWTQKAIMTDHTSHIRFLSRFGIGFSANHFLQREVYAKLLSELGRRFVALYDPSAEDGFWGL